MGAKEGEFNVERSRCVVQRGGRKGRVVNLVEKRFGERVDEVFWKEVKITKFLGGRVSN